MNPTLRDSRGRARWWSIATLVVYFMVLGPLALAHGLLFVLLGAVAVAAASWALGFAFDRLRAVRQHQRECDERYERAARGAHDGLWEWELASGRTYYSARWCEMLGL